MPQKMFTHEVLKLYVSLSFNLGRRFIKGMICIVCCSSVPHLVCKIITDMRHNDIELL